MTAQTISSTLPPSFNGLDGFPLTGGSVYVGLPALDPRQYPVATFYDAAMAVPAAQPLRTQAGFLYRNGAPTNIWLADGVYSLMVLDAQDRLVLYVPSWTTSPSVTIRDPVVDRFSGTGAQTVFALSVVPGSENSTDVFVGGVYVQKDAYSVAGNLLTFAVAPAIGTSNIEVNTQSTPEFSAVVGSLSALVASSAAFSAASASSATASAGSAAAASGFKDAAAAILALIGSGGSGLERSQSFTGGTFWTLTGPVVSVTKIFINGVFFRLNNFTLAGLTVQYTGSASAALPSNSLIDIFYI